MPINYLLNLEKCVSKKHPSVSTKVLNCKYYIVNVMWHCQPCELLLTVRHVR
nr:MAG TPA: hypothetical protein [Caudoviricetes sp.]